MTSQTAARQEYDVAHAKFLKVSAEHRAVTLAYRAREIGDDEFLASRAAFIAADKEFDLAEIKFDEAVA